MTIKKRSVFLTLLALVLAGGLTVGGVALAHGGPDFAAFHGSGGPVKIFRMIRQLDLTDEQLSRVEAIHDLASKVRQRHGEHRGSHAERVIGKLERGESFDPADARALVDQHLEEARVTAYALTDELTALANSLDAEQRRLLAEHLGAMLEAHGEDGGH